MPAPRIAQASRHRALRILLTGAVAFGLATGVAGCVAPGSAEPEPSAGGQAAAGTTPSAGTPTPSPSPSATVTPAPAPAAPALDPLAAPLVAAGHSLSEGTAGLAPVDALAALDQATATLEADVGAMSGSGASVDAARIAADIDGVLTSTHTVRQGVVDSAIRVVNEESPNADQALRDDLYLAIVDQQAQTAATDDTPRQVLDLVTKLLAVQDSEAAFAAAQQAAAGGPQRDGGAPADPGNHVFPPPVWEDGPEQYCPDPGRPQYCVPISSAAPPG